MHSLILVLLIAAARPETCDVEVAMITLLFSFYINPPPSVACLCRTELCFSIHETHEWCCNTFNCRLTSHVFFFFLSTEISIAKTAMFSSLCLRLPFTLSRNVLLGVLFFKIKVHENI